MLQGGGAPAQKTVLEYSMAITWREDLAIGVEEIDSQHKTLFGKVDALFEACNSGKGKMEIGNTLEYLGDYVVEHFTAEEKLMKKGNYPGFLTHKGIHDKFVKEFKAIREAFDKEGANASLIIQMNKLLVDWLIQHVKKTDKEYVPYLKK